MVEQIFLSSQMKPRVVISNIVYISIFELRHKFSNDLRLKTLGN